MPPNESVRLNAVARTIEGSPSNRTPSLLRCARLAAQAFDARYAAVTLVDQSVHRFVTVHGVDLDSVPRDQFFCAHTILSDEVLTIPDASSDIRFARLPLVSGSMGIRFYAGAPVTTGDGQRIGALCVFDTNPRRGFTAADEDSLRDLAELASRALGIWQQVGPPSTPAGGLSTAAGDTPVSGAGVTPMRPAGTSFRGQLRPAEVQAKLQGGLDSDPVLLQQIVDMNPNPVFVRDREGRFVLVNEAASSLYGLPFESILGRSEPELAASPSSFRRLATTVRTIDGDECREEHVVDAHGRARWYQVVDQAVENGSFARHTLTIATDVTRVRTARSRQDARRDVMRRVVGSSSLSDVIRRVAEFVEAYLPESCCVIWVRGSEGLRLGGAPNAPSTLARRLATRAPVLEKATVGADPEHPQRHLYSGRIVGEVQTQVYGLAAREAGLGFCDSYAIFSSGGTVIGTVDALTPVGTADLEGVAEIMESAAGLVALAVEHRQRSTRSQYDPLTRLPNRYVLDTRIRTAIGGCRRNGTMAAVLSLDIDRFKKINDTLGHSVGDALLQEVAARLETCMRTTDTLARTGGDEFAIMITEFDDLNGATTVATKLLDAVERPVEIAGYNLVFTASIGIAVFPNDGADAATLRRNADAALFRAKEQGRNCFQFFAADIHDSALERLRLETALRDATTNHEFSLFLQPQLDLRGGDTVGFEVLLRWKHPVLGDIPPSKFIPIAEETGLIMEIGAWVINEACRVTRAWIDDGQPEFSVGVNVSAAQLSDPNLVRQVASALRIHGLDPRYLELEITESLMMRDVEETIERLEELRRIGVRISIDDFGTGYSSLAYLQRLPADRVKIDRAFVVDVGQPDTRGRQAEALVRTIVDIAHNLGLEVVAEGVETKAQLDFLRHVGCEFVQGYYYSPPSPADEAFRAEGDRRAARQRG